MAAKKVEMGPSRGQQVAEALASIRTERIRSARARTPTPTYEQIAFEVGCCVKTVYNTLTRPQSTTNDVGP